MPRVPFLTGAVPGDLTIHDQQARHLFLRIDTDLPRPGLRTGLPKQQVADREALVHRIEQVTDLRRPHTNGR